MALGCLDVFLDHCIGCRCMPISSFHGRSVEHGCTVVNIFRCLSETVVILDPSPS